MGIVQMALNADGGRRVPCWHGGKDGMPEMPEFHPMPPCLFRENEEILSPRRRQNYDDAGAIGDLEEKECWLGVKGRLEMPNMKNRCAD